MSAKKRQIQDIAGKRYGRLVAEEFKHYDEKHRDCWGFRCDCGNKKIIAAANVKWGGVRSCGCLAAEHLADMSKKNITHGMTGTRLYGCYKGMMSRCYREKDIHYNAYGKRGIAVCAEWKNKPDVFIKWAVSHGYSDALTLDRINVNGNYEPSNCRWIPMSEQYKNKQSNSGKMPLPEPYREVIEK